MAIFHERFHHSTFAGAIAAVGPSVLTAERTEVNRESWIVN
jgi:hypothetical protein